MNSDVVVIIDAKGVASVYRRKVNPFGVVEFEKLDATVIRPKPGFCLFRVCSKGFKFAFDQAFGVLLGWMAS